MQKGGWLDSYEDGGFPLKTTGPRETPKQEEVPFPYGGQSFMYDNGAGYKMDRAKELGYTPDATGHMPSRDYKTGEYLKDKYYPTSWKSNLIDQQMDYQVYQDGESLYSRPNKKANGGWLDSFDEGGHVHPHKDSRYSLPTYSSSVGSEALRASINTPTEKPRFETEQERFLRENAEALKANTPASGRADALYGLEDPIFMAALTGAQTVGAAATGLGAKTLYPYARAIGEELSMGLTEAPNLLYQVGKAGLKGAKRAADSGSQAYKDYLAKPLRKDLEPKQIKKAVIKDKDTKIMDSFKDKPSPDHTDVINLVPDAAKSKQLGMETFSINKGNKNVGEISGERLPNGDFQTMDIGVNPKFQKQGIATEAYKELNKSLPKGNKVTSFGAYVKQADGVAPGKNTWASLERKGLARKNNQGIYEMIPAPDYIDVSKSEIDWGKWNKEIPDNKPLMKEYNAIEQSTKADGTWMKNADGTKFEGTPEQFVQQNSKNFKKAFKNTKVLDEHGNPKIVYHGTRTSDGIKKQGYSKSMSGKGNRGADEGNIYFSDSYKNAEYTGVKADEFEEVFKNVQATQNHFKTKGNFINVPSTDSLNKAARKAEKEMHEFRKAKDHVNGGNKPTIFNKKKVNAELDRLDKLETDAFNRRKSLQEDAHQASMYHSGINYLKGNKNGYYQNPLNLTRRKFNLDEPTKIDQNVKDLVINSAYNTEGLRYSPDVLSNYVNIEKPLVKDFGYKSTDVNPLKAGFVESMGYSNKIEPHLKELAKDDYTGAIQKNLFDVLHGDVYLVKNPNNIKSAVGNNGMFDMSDPNIYKAVTGIATAGALGASATEQKNGGWLDTFHDGGEIGHIHEGDKVVQGTHAYRKAYNEGKIATQGDGYLQAPDLPVFEVNAAEQEKEKMDYITGLKKPYYKPGESVHIRPDFRGGLTSRIGNYAAGSDKFFAREASDITNTGGVNREEKYGPEVYDFYRNYFGLPLKTDAVQISKYRPTNETDPSSTYYSNTSKDLKSDIINIYNTLSPKQKENIKKEPSILVDGYSPKSYNTHNWKGLSKEQRDLLKTNRNYSTGIGQFRLGEGEDAEGKYISYYDVFDKATGGTFKGANENLLGAAKPFEIYDRIYLNDFENISKKKNGGWLDTFEEGGYTSASINVPPRRKTTTTNPYKFLYDPSILDTSNTTLPAESTMVDTQRNVPTEYDIDAIVENIKQQEAADINYKKNYYELERQKEIKGSEKSTKIDKINNIGALNKKELIDVQRALVDKGYLNSPDLEINAKDKDAVSKIQKMLVDKDYDLGKYGPNKDGVDGLFGRKTKAALSKYNYEKEIDGVIGPKTELAFSQYKKDKGREKNTLESLNIPLDFIEGKDLQSRLQNKNYFKNKIEDFNLNTDNILIKSEKGAFKINSEKKCTAKHCSQYVGEEIEKKVKATGRENVGAFGDAWTIHTNLMGAGAKEIYNVFPDVKPSINNPEQYIKNLTKLTPMVSPEDLKSGDVVNMYYGGSTNHSKAYEKGHKVFSTHVGIIKEDIDGNKYVEHNVGSKIYKEPLLKILNNKSTTKTGKPLRITAITRPQYNIQTFDGIYEPTQSQINFDKVRNPKTSFSKKESAEFVQTLINNKKPLLKDIPISSPEMDNLIKAARVLQWKESNVTPQPKKDNTRWLSELRENVGIRESSEGYTQMKDEENLNPALRENLKIDNSALRNPKTAAIATIYALSTKYIQIKSSIKDLNKYTDDEIAQLAVISWNEPVDMVIKTANKYGNLQEVVQAYKDDYGYNKKGGTEFPYDLTLTAYNRYLK